jgi:HAMP domain-containing protein
MSYARTDYAGRPITDPVDEQRRLAREEWDRREKARLERVVRLRKALATLSVEDLMWAQAEAQDSNLAMPSAQVGFDGRPYTRIGALHQAIGELVSEKERQVNTNG